MKRHFAAFSASLVCPAGSTREASLYMHMHTHNTCVCQICRDGLFLGTSTRTTWRSRPVQVQGGKCDGSY